MKHKGKSTGSLMKIPMVISSFLLFATASLAEGDRLKVNPYGVFLSDSNGLVSVEMAILEEKNSHGFNDVIMIMRGFYPYEAGIDNKAIRYTVRSGGKGLNYVYKKNGKELVRMISRKRWGNYSNIKVSLAGRLIAVSREEEASKEVRPLHLVTALSKTPRPNEYPEVNPYGIAFHSEPQGLFVEMAQVSEKNEDGLKDIIVKMSGQDAHSAGIDKKTIRYRAVLSKGIDYKYKKDGKWKTRFSLRNKNGDYGRGFEAYLGGLKTFKLYIRGRLSREVRPVHLFYELKK